jgi:hypothetical protein
MIEPPCNTAQLKNDILKCCSHWSPESRMTTFWERPNCSSEVGQRPKVWFTRRTQPLQQIPFLLTWTRSVCFTNHVSHSSFITNKRSQVDRFWWVIFGKSLNFTAMPLGPLLRVEAHRPMTRSAELSVRLKITPISSNSIQIVHTMQKNNYCSMARLLPTNAPRLTLISATWQRTLTVQLPNSRSSNR